MCDSIIASSKKKNVENLAGELSLLQTAALMKNANMNYANDSAAVHIASAMNAPITAVYCSTIPEFGFGPLSEKSFVVQVKEKLTCRPCGLHGKKSCPEKHFKCALTIDVDELLTTNN
jgi:heptosyltransferase-2